MTPTKTIGKPTNRVDGHKKVTGAATYSAEYNFADLVHGFIVNTTITKGKIVKMNTEKISEIHGVRKIFTHLNLPDYINKKSDFSDPLSPPGNPFRPLHDENIIFNGQPIALIVADTFEVARYAAGLLEVEYEEEEFHTNIRRNLENATHKDVPDPAKKRGNAEKAFEKSEVQVEVEYFQEREYHNPMETYSSIAIWDEKEKSYEVYDKIQGVASSQAYISGIFHIKKDKVRVYSPFMGGGFGSGLRPQYQLFFAALASRELNLPVKVVMTRKQMFTFGHRPACLQRIKLGADKNGKLNSILHSAFAETSKFEKFNETIVDWSGLMYDCENVKLDYKLVPVDVYTPLDMRGPGGTTGMYALESAMDELAEKAGIDPLQLRLINYAENDQNEDKPFSSKELRACYERAADEFGWKNRKDSGAGNNLRDNQWVGYGMATGCWEALQKKSAAKAILTQDGKLTVSSATSDIGTGTYTVMTQIAAETMGLNMDQVQFNLGDTNLSESPIEGGSWTVSSVGSAVKMVCMELRKELFGLAKRHNDVSQKEILEDARFENGELLIKDQRIPFSEILQAAKKDSVEIEVTSKPDKDRDKHSFYTHSCVMVEVNVDKDLKMITVPRAVSAVAGGKIINPKTAESQIIGGITWGIGMALEEEGMMDDRFGRIMNPNLAEYHVPVHADVQDLKVFFIDEHDEYVNPLGAKGLGEIGLVGVAAAISNAIYNATRKRVRELPIHLDDVM